MPRKTGVIIFTHGSRRKSGNELVFQLAEQIRRQLGAVPIEPCFMELGKPPIPVALRKLVRDGCTHIFGYALFLVPGAHWQEDLPFIFSQTLKKFPGVTWEISPPMLVDPLLGDYVANQIKQALKSK